MSEIAVVGIAGCSVFLPVENFHVGGETVEATDARSEYGGKGFNQAVAAARMGSSVSFLAAVGEADWAGISGFLEQEKIHHTLVKKSGASAFAAIVTDKTGANRVTVYQGPQLSLADVEGFRREIENAKYLILTNETSFEVNAAAAEIAYKAGVKIILNPAPARSAPRDFLDKVWLFTPNAHEADGLEGYENILQTLGSDGCLLKERDITIPSIPCNAVDTTGAGDTFNGVLAAMLCQGRDLEEAAKVAVSASGLGVTRHGAVSSIPYRNEIFKE